MDFQGFSRCLGKSVCISSAPPPSSVQACRREVIAREMGDFLAEDMVVWAGRWPGPDSHDPSFDPYTPLAVDSGDVERGELSAAVHSART